MIASASCNYRLGYSSTMRKFRETVTGFLGEVAAVLGCVIFSACEAVRRIDRHFIVQSVPAERYVVLCRHE